MRENRYQTLMEEIRVPKSLEEQVLFAAHQQAKQPIFRRKQPVWRAAVCAVLALLLVAGGISLRPLRNEPEKVKLVESLDLLELGRDFGLTAYAADVFPAANGNLVLGGGTIVGGK